NERDAPGPALSGIHPIAGPWIFAHVGIAAEPDVKAVKPVVEDRQPDAEELEKEDQRKVREETDLARVRLRAADRSGIRNKNVLEEKCADRDDSGQGMQSAQQKRDALAGAQRSYPAPQCRR